MFYLTFRRTPGEGSPHFDRFDGQNFTFPALSEGIRVFRPLRRSTKDAVFGNCKPLKRLDLNFNMGFATSSNPCVETGVLISVILKCDVCQSFVNLGRILTACTCRIRSSATATTADCCSSLYDFTCVCTVLYCVLTAYSK